jgi:hypothetical protein
MNRSPENRTGGAALRPWPFGPPLRGRAAHSAAGPQAARRRASWVLRASPATAPVGGLASGHPCSAL